MLDRIARGQQLGCSGWIVLVLVFGVSISGCKSQGASWQDAQTTQVNAMGVLGEPSWAPDDSRVIVTANFTRGPNSKSSLIVTEGDGSWSIFPSVGTDWLTEPHWSSDGKALSYGIGCETIQFVEYPSGHQLFSQTGCGFLWPASSEVGVAFVHGPASNNASVSEIWESSIGSSPLRRLLYNNGAEANGGMFGGFDSANHTGEIALSIGGYRQDGSSSTLDRDIFIIASNDTVSELVATHSDEYDPGFSPDGRWLVYLKMGAALESNEDSSQTIALVSIDPGNCLIEFPVSGTATGIAWSQ